MNSTKRVDFQTQLMLANSTVRDLLRQIDDVEKDFDSSVSEKLAKIKKIKEEITKVGTEIDNIKREIRLLTTYNVN